MNLKNKNYIYLAALGLSFGRQIFALQCGVQNLYLWPVNS